MLHYKVYHSQSSVKGTDIVLLHGFLEDLSMWESVLDLFQDRKVLLVDFPGHGQSPHYDLESYSMSFMAKKVEEVLTKESFNDPLIIGHSMGGYVGLELINNIQVEHLVLLNSTFWKDSEERRYNRNRVIEVVKKNKNIFLQEAIKNLFYIESEEISNQINKLIKNASNIPVEEIIKSTIGLRDRCDHSQTVANNSSKISIVQAENDPIISLDQMQESFSRDQKKPELIIMKNSGHMSIWENPKATSRILNKLV